LEFIPANFESRPWQHRNGGLFLDNPYRTE
jgi:hypothetical protein